LGADNYTWERGDNSPLEVIFFVINYRVWRGMVCGWAILKTLLKTTNIGTFVLYSHYSSCPQGNPMLAGALAYRSLPHHFPPSYLNHVSVNGSIM